MPRLARKHRPTFCSGRFLPEIPGLQPLLCWELDQSFVNFRSSMSLECCRRNRILVAEYQPELHPRSPRSFLEPPHLGRLH